MHIDRNLTSADCRKSKFTGIRENKLNDDMEIWVMGAVAATVTKNERLLNPSAMARAYEKVFGMEQGTIDG